MKAKIKSNLVIITNNYPLDMGEPYLEDELLITYKAFNKIYIISTDKHVRSLNKDIFFVPQNAEKVLLPLSKMRIKDRIKWSYKLFSLECFKEVFWIFVKYRIKDIALVLKVFISSVLNGHYFKSILEKELLKKGVNINDSILYSYWTSEITYGLIKMKKKFPDAKIISRSHGWDLFFERNTPMYLPLRRYMIQGCDKYTTISETGKKYLISKLNIKDIHSIKVSKLGVRDQKNRIEFESSSIIRIVSISIIQTVKQLGLLVDSLQLINDYKIEWLHIGGGALFNNFTEEVKEKLEGKINISYKLVETLPHYKVIKIFSQKTFDFLINTSCSEGLPVSMMEAMSFSVPVIGTNVGGVSEIISDGINGYLLPAMATKHDIVNSINTYQKLSIDSKLKLRENAYKYWYMNYRSDINYGIFVKEILKENI